MSQTQTDPLAPPTTETKKADKPKIGEAKGKADKGEQEPRRSKFALLYPDESKIKLLVKDNPKKEGSKAREKFQHYFSNTTVGTFIAAGGTYSTIAYDVGRKFIEVTVPTEKG